MAFDAGKIGLKNDGIFCEGHACLRVCIGGVIQMILRLAEMSIHRMGRLCFRVGPTIRFLSSVGMGLQPAKFHEKMGTVASTWPGGADPLVRGRRPRRPAHVRQDADVVGPAAGRGRPARTRGSASPFPEGGFSPLSHTTRWPVTALCADAAKRCMLTPREGYQFETSHFHRFRSE